MRPVCLPRHPAVAYLFLVRPQMRVLANVVFPLFALPYVAGVFSPWFAAGALAGEILVFFGFQFRSAGFWLVLAAVLTSNFVSTLIGFFGLGLIPNPEHAPKWFAYLSFVIAWALSVAIEYGVYSAVPRWRQFRKLFLATAISNVVSYAILGVALWTETA
jgi:hypothetical protein